MRKLLTHHELAAAFRLAGVTCAEEVHCCNFGDQRRDQCCSEEVRRGRIDRLVCRRQWLPDDEIESLDAAASLGILHIQDGIVLQIFDADLLFGDTTR